MSSTFSFCVPRLRCFKLQHEGLSQECITTMPSGISPFINNQAIRCASSDFPLNLNLPYPALLKAVQFQHSSSRPTSTLSQKRFIPYLCPGCGSRGVFRTNQSSYWRNPSLLRWRQTIDPSRRWTSSSPWCQHAIGSGIEWTRNRRQIRRLPVGVLTTVGLAVSSTELSKCC